MTEQKLGRKEREILFGKSANVLDRRLTIGMRDARMNFSKIVNAAKSNNERIVITEHGAPACALVPIGDLRMLDAIVPEKHRTYTFDAEVVRVLYDRREIAIRVAEMAAQIAAAGFEKLLIVSLLNGGFVFAADLMRSLYSIGFHADIGFITISSYGDGTASMGARVKGGLNVKAAGRDVLLVDDVIETGQTLALARELLMARDANRVATAVMVDKPGHRDPGIRLDLDFVGFECDTADWLVGYGMDFNKGLRELPFIGTLTIPPHRPLEPTN